MDIKKSAIKVKRTIYESLGIRVHPLIIQIELAGKCTANCSFCDWTRRQKSQQIFMDTTNAKKAVKEAREMKADLITFHVTGESLDHPDLFEIMPTDYPVGLSTNCLSLAGERAVKLSEMENMNLTLAILWDESDIKRETSICNATNFLEMNPKCKTINIQMVCSVRSIPYASFMHDHFRKYVYKIPGASLFYKQGYTQEPDNPIITYIPTNINCEPGVVVDTMSTPQSCGSDCLAIAPNPMTSILIQVDGQIKPCFIRPEDPLKKDMFPPEFHRGWGTENISSMTLQEYWNSEKLKYIRKIWSKGDPEGKLPCHNCIRMVSPKENMWWNTTGVVPTELDVHQAKKGDPSDPYAKPNN